MLCFVNCSPFTWTYINEMLDALIHVTQILPCGLLRPRGLWSCCCWGRPCTRCSQRFPRVNLVKNCGKSSLWAISRSTVSSGPCCGLCGPSGEHSAFCLFWFAATQLLSLRGALCQIIDDFQILFRLHLVYVDKNKTRKLTKIWLIFLVYVSLKVADHHLGVWVLCSRKSRRCHFDIF